jgi:hypothetical protein
VKEPKALKEALPAMWKEVETKPQYLQAVVFRGGGDKLLAEIDPLKEPMANDAKFPENLVVITKKPKQGGGYENKEETFPRFVGKGDLVDGSKSQSMVVYPGDKRSRENIDRIVGAIKARAQDLKNVIYGVEAPESSGGGTRGIVKRGESADGIGDELYNTLDQVEHTQKK